jgi:hypothetical protein
VRRRGAIAVLVVGLAIAACGTTVVPRAPRVLTVPGVVGSEMALQIVDETGELLDAAAVTGEALGAVAMPLEGPIAAMAGAQPNEVRVVWISLACQISGQMRISSPGTISITNDPVDACDAIGNHRAVDLSFRVPVNVRALQVELLPIDGKGEKG